jgi:translation initiation factor 3 subunit F
VVFSILDHYTRRNEDQTRVIGTLLGERKAGGKEIVIKNCFPVPHSETEDTVEVDMEHQEQMVALHKRTNPKQVVVGWYATGGDDSLTYISSVIHDLYVRRGGGKVPPNPLYCKQPVHLTVDVNCTGARLGVKAYTAQTLRVASKEPVLARFSPVDVEVHASDAEKIGLDALINGAPDDEALDAPATLLSDIDSIRETMSNLQGKLKTVSDYVSKVAAGDAPADAKIGRAITDALMSVPSLSSEHFEQIFNANIQDLLMVTYLANLTRTQLALGDRIAGLL